MRDWHWFSGAVRTSVKGSGIVADILEAIIDGRGNQAVEILAREEKSFDRLDEFLAEAEKLMKTDTGRRQLKSIALQHRTESRFATDDISLRRAYGSLLRGEQVKSLPQIGLKGKG